MPMVFRIIFWFLKYFVTKISDAVLKMLYFQWFNLTIEKKDHILLKFEGGRGKQQTALKS
jgi:hypothetical protein